MSIYEFDQEQYIKMEKQDSYEEGIQEGMEKGMDTLRILVKRLIDDNRKEEIEKMISNVNYTKQLLEEYHII